ncbi:hypothetical protein CASFOL_035261 [Castilleja foliolosa]|uniref:NAC domain-containing protein n=1 Tax=Castilleja foliolosa TaxID=1961234 RepID=A0ABD3BTC0_9LAMI
MENNNNNNSSNEKGHDQDIVASTSGTANQSSFPAGYRFVPTDDELITHYLAKKVNDEPIPVDDMYKVDLYSHPPNELAETYRKLGDGEWYFFTPRVRKYPKGGRPRRSVGDIGYWKATGADKEIKSKEGVTIGKKKSLVFYYGKPKSGQEKKTNWIMHEYKLHTPSKSHETGMTLDDCILCKIYERPERLNKKHNDVNGPVADDEDQQKIEDPPAIALHIPDNNNNNIINSMGQNHQQLSTMMTEFSTRQLQPQNNGHVPMNSYGDNSHQFQTQYNGHVPILNSNRDHSHQFQTNYDNQHRFQQVPAHLRIQELYGRNSNFGSVMPIHDQEQAPWGYQERGDLQRVYRGQNGTYFLEDPYNISNNFAFDQGRLRANSATKMRHQQQGDFQHDYDQEHNGNNVEQDPDDNIYSYYPNFDEDLRANLDDVTTRRRHHQQGDLQHFYKGHNENNVEQHPHNYQGHSGNNVQQDPHNYQGHNGNNVQQDPHNYQGHNGNNFEQDPHNYQGHNGNNVQQDPHNYQGHNGNNFEQDPHNYQGHNGNNAQQDPHNYQGHNGNNVEQDPNGINSNFGVDEGLRANPDDGATKRPDDQLC